MAQRGKVFPVRSISTTHFTSAAATNVGLVEDLPFPGAIGASGDCRIVSLAIWAVQNLDYEVWLFRNNYLGGVAAGGGGILPANTNPAFDLKGAVIQPLNEGTPGTGISFAGRWKWVAGNGVQLGNPSGTANGPYYYYIDGNDIAYSDEVVPLGPTNFAPKLHVVLVNRNVTGKSAGAAGALTLQIVVEPTGY